MARRHTPSKPERPIHTADQKRRDIDRLSRRIKELETFDPQSVTKRFTDPKLAEIETAIDETLASVYGHGTVDYDRYSSAAQLDHGPVTTDSTPDWIEVRGGGGGFSGYQDEAFEARQYIAEGKQRSLSLLRQAVRGLEEEIELEQPVYPDVPSEGVRPKPSRKIFIVHGHDEGLREAVARFLERIGFDPIILHEKANQGRTVIEKVEAHGEVGFAVVLLTPDDEGYVKGGTPQPRARQNVLLELGYFVGRLGRDHVCALQRGDVEIPSDWRGVISEPFDATGNWKQTLARELQAAGYEIDWNNVMR